MVTGSVSMLRCRINMFGLRSVRGVGTIDALRGSIPGSRGRSCQILRCDSAFLVGVGGLWFILDGNGDGDDDDAFFGAHGRFNIGRR